MQEAKTDEACSKKEYTDVCIPLSSLDLMCGELSIADIPAIAKHADWVAAFAPKYNFTAKNVRGILEDEIGKTFVRVLEDAGVYKRNEDGKSAFLRFVDAVNAEK